MSKEEEETTRKLPACFIELASDAKITHATGVTFLWLQTIVARLLQLYLKCSEFFDALSVTKGTTLKTAVHVASRLSTFNAFQNLA